MASIGQLLAGATQKCGLGSMSLSGFPKSAADQFLEPSIAIQILSDYV
jgi:hypothetical protein